MLYPIKMNIGWKCTQDIQDVDELLCNAQFLINKLIYILYGVRMSKS